MRRFFVTLASGGACACSPAAARVRAITRQGHHSHFQNRRRRCRPRRQGQRCLPPLWGAGKSTRRSMSPCGSTANCANRKFNVVMTRSSEFSFHSTTGSPSRTGRKTPSSSAFISTIRAGAGFEGFETYYHSPCRAHLAIGFSRHLFTLPGAVESRRAYGRLSGPAQRALSGGPGGMRIPQQPQRRRDARRAPSYRDKLADKIAEAIVDQRYGNGTYRRRRQVRSARHAGGTARVRPSSRALASPTRIPS